MGGGDGVGHKYFVHRHSQNFATPARLFFLLKKHDCAFQLPHATEEVQSLPAHFASLIVAGVGVEPTISRL